MTNKSSGNIWMIIAYHPNSDVHIHYSKMIFSSMTDFMGLAVASLVHDQYMYDTGSTNIGHDAAESDFDHGNGGPTDMGGFDVNF